MKRVAGCVLLAAVASCAGRAAERRTFVQEATIQGFDLVLTKCEVHAVDDQIKLGQCEVVRQRLPVMVDREEPGPPANGLDQEQVSRGITTAIRDSLASCVQLDHVGGSVRVRLEISSAGRVTSVEPSAGGAELATCMRGAFAEARFAAAQQPTKLTFTVRGAP